MVSDRSLSDDHLVGCRTVIYCTISKPDPAGLLRSFRVGLYDCFTGWAETLFEFCDAIVCSPAAVDSVPSLSLEPVFRRGHGSLYYPRRRCRYNNLVNQLGVE